MKPNSTGEFLKVLECASVHAVERNKLDSEEVLSKVRTALSSLPSRERGVMQLFLSGKSFDDISSALGVSLRVVEQTYWNGLGLLRKEIPMHLIYDSKK